MDNLGLSSDTLQNNSDVKNFTDINELVKNYKNKARKGYLQERLRNSNQKLREIETRVTEIDGLLERNTTVGNQQKRLLNERQRLFSERRGLIKLRSQLQSMNDGIVAENQSIFNQMNKQEGKTELVTNIRKMLAAGDNQHNKMRLANDLEQSIRKNLNQLVNIRTRRNRGPPNKNAGILKNKLRNIIIYNLAIIRRLNVIDMGVTQNLMREFNDEFAASELTQFTPDEYVEVMDEIDEMIGELTDLSQSRERFLIETFNAYL